MTTSIEDVMWYAETEVMKHEGLFKSVIDTIESLIHRLDGVEARLDKLDKEAATCGNAQPNL